MRNSSGTKNVSSLGVPCSSVPGRTICRVAAMSQKQLLKLSEESLMKEPEEVFDLEEKIGEGYGHCLSRPTSSVQRINSHAVVI